MRKIAMIIITLVVLGICVLSKETVYSFWGGMVFIGLMTAASLKELYEYKKNRSEISDINFILKRDNSIWKLLNCFLVVTYCIDNFINDKFVLVNDMRFMLISILSVYVLCTLYCSAFNRPIAFADGFLCSDGRIISLSDIKSIGAEKTFFKYNKKLIVTCGREQFIFIMKNYEYEGIKSMIETFNTVTFYEN